MLDALKTLFENNVLSEDVRQEIEEAWNAKIKENRLQVTSQLREEFAQKYEHDKSIMVEAVDKMVSEKLEAEMVELAEDRKQLIEAKAKYKIAMKENANLLRHFVSQSLVKEVKELHDDQKSMATKFRMLEEFIVDSLAKEIAEFQTDKQDLATTKVKLVKEAKSKFGLIKTRFLEESSKKMTNLIEKVLTKEITQLKEDIDSARKHDFGRKIFEAFATEYNSSYLNKKSESAKLLKILSIKDKQLAEAKKVIAGQKTVVSKKDTQIKQLAESAKRQQIISELIDPLNKSQKEIMMDLLESVQTDRLKTSFDRYLPTVIDNKKPQQKAIITEGKEITGNKKEDIKKSGARDNVIDIRRLAGLN